MFGLQGRGMFQRLFQGKMWTHECRIKCIILFLLREHFPAAYWYQQGMSLPYNGIDVICETRSSSREDFLVYTLTNFKAILDVFYRKTKHLFLKRGPSTYQKKRNRSYERGDDLKVCTQFHRILVSSS